MGIYDNQNLVYKLEIDKTLTLNNYKDVTYSLTKNNDNILIISSFINKNSEKFIKLHLNISKDNHINNSL